MPILPGCVGETYVGVVCSHPERLSVVVLDSILPSGAEERFASEFLRSVTPATPVSGRALRHFRVVFGPHASALAVQCSEGGLVSLSGKPHEPKSSFNSVFHATKTVRSSRRLPRVRRVSSRCAAPRNVSPSLRATAAWSGSSPRSIAPLVTAHRTPRSGGTGMVDAELDNVRLLGRRIAMSIVVDT